MKRIAQEKNGMIIYLNQEGRGIGLTNKIRAYELQDKGMDTADANKALGFKIDERDMWVAADIIKQFKIKGIRLMTNNPEKISALKKYGINNIQREPVEIEVNNSNIKYLRTKNEKMGHKIPGI